MQEILQVFVDFEYTDFLNTDPISVGLAAEGGQEFYGESLDFNRSMSSAFVKTVVYPLLDPVKFGMSEIELSARAWAWLDELPSDNIVIVVDNHADWSLFKYLINDPHPKVKGWQNIWTILAEWVYSKTVSSGGGPYEHKQLNQKVSSYFLSYVQAYFKRTGEHPHHSLSDAKANREAFSLIKKEFEIP